jgi:hypothetical protein
LVIGKFVEQLCFRGFAGVGGEDPVHIGPDDQFVGVNDVSDEYAGEVRAVSAERGDTAVAGRTDKTSDDGNQIIGKKRQKNFAAASACFVNLRPGIAESFAGQDKLGRADGNRALKRSP